jgi:hypothetical protein
MSCLDKRPPDMTVTGLGDASAFGSATTGMLAGHEAQVGHYLLRRVKAGQVTDFGNGRCSNNQGNTV